MAKHVAIMGVTGAVGSEFLKILQQRNFPVASLKVLASHRSAGKKVEFRGEPLVVEELTNSSFQGVELVLASAGGSVSRQFVPAAVAAGAVVVDNTSAFRMDGQVPLVIPEINAEDIKGHQGIIANPNCSTIVMNVPVWPLHQVNRIQRIVVSTYQAVSGAGAWAMWELDEQIKAYAAGKPIVKKKFPHPIVNNLFSHDTDVGPDGYNLEETKMVRETRKIFHDQELRITATCIRIPVMRAHCESINLQFTDPIGEQQVRQILAAAPGVKIVDDRENNYFPMPVDAADQDDVLVGRIRQDVSQPDGRGIEMFVAGDQIRKGAALNAVQIAEML